MSPSPSLTIRSAHAADAAPLARLAALDSSRVPNGELLIAELEAQRRARPAVLPGALGRVLLGRA